MANSPKKKSFEDAKEELLHMDQETKRGLYKCGDNFVPLDKIPPWPEYVEKNQKDIDNLALGEDIITKLLKGKLYKVNDTLNRKVTLFQGDITTLEIDAIVNAANNRMLGGGGVDGAIHKAAGSLLYDECKTMNGCETGDAKITFGYKLPAKWVIHAVGPMGFKPDLLHSCYLKCLQLAKENKLRSIAFPCISTGVFGYPQKRAALLAINTVRSFLEQHGESIDRIIFCVFLEEDLEIYQTLLPVFFPVEKKSGDDANTSSEVD